MNEDEICPDTGLAREDCPCMWCSPPMFYFKYMISDYDCKSIDDVIKALNSRLMFFKKLKDDGFRLMGPVEDHFVEIEPPDSDDAYWVECRSGGCYLKFPSGTPPPKKCPECGKNLYEYEEK
jgi:hypothetical protein